MRSGVRNALEGRKVASLAARQCPRYAGELMNPLYEQMRTSVFERMSALAAEHNAVNLGQGFPDFGWPDEILEFAARAVREGSNQYPPSRGTIELREAVAAHYNRHFGEELESSQITVTSGATEALGSAILASVEVGDEVMILAPAYDSYAPMIRRAGGVPVEVALKAPDWRIERQALEEAVSARTRAIIFNNPHNPAGRLFEKAELEIVSSIACQNDLLVISDEVWEHIILDAQRFTPLATLPGMKERTIKIGSAGKIFSLTGWKVGWMVAAPALAPVLARAHQFLTFSTAPSLQSAVAYGLNEGDTWLQPMRDRFQRSRDLLASGLRAHGFAVLDANATYFLCVDLEASGLRMDDEEFARAAVTHAGIAAIPLSAFQVKDPPRHLVRLCFGKKDETIQAGVVAMGKAREMIA
jgi:N-succinyldiaminopimelate aminotransferase